MTEAGLALIAGPILGDVALGALLGPPLARVALALVFIAVRLMPAFVRIGSPPHGRLSTAGLQASWRE